MSTDSLRRLWKTVFGDSDAFLDSFFTIAYSPERCKFYQQDGEAICALYWFDCGCLIRHLYSPFTLTLIHTIVYTKPPPFTSTVLNIPSNSNNQFHKLHYPNVFYYFARFSPSISLLTTEIYLYFFASMRALMICLYALL